MEAVISIYLDTRQEKTDGTYPVKIKVYASGMERKYYPTGISLTEADFNTIITSEKLKGKLKEYRDKLDEKKGEATKIAKTLDPFDINTFDMKFKRPKNSKANLFFYFDHKIAEFRKEGRIKSALVYENTRDSVKRFLYPNLKIDELRADKSLVLQFSRVNVKWLEKYEAWMREQGHTVTTMSIYLRSLRAIFNMAIADKEIPNEIYPFTRFRTEKGKYKIPVPSDDDPDRLTDGDLLKLGNFKTDDPLINKARDFWFFIYYGYGMNARDIASLKASNIKKDKDKRDIIEFIREKTKRTNQKEKKIRVPINAHMKNVIEKYRTSGPYLFEYLNNEKTEEGKVKASDAFVTFINDHMERLKDLINKKYPKDKIEINPTTYAARRAFGTHLIQKGQSMEFVMKAYGHKNLTTTQGYIGEFQDSAKWVASNLLPDYLNN
jgi:site-specific recombinase XerD